VGEARRERTWLAGVVDWVIHTFLWSEITDFQTDLMLFIGDIPELKPHFNADGFDPLLRMRNRGTSGQVPRGIVSGTWLWAVNLPNYPDQLWPLFGNICWRPVFLHHL
jgi:hypothetical protein